MAKEYTIHYKNGWQLMGKPARTQPVSDTEVNLFFKQSKGTASFKKQCYFKTSDKKKIPYVSIIEVPLDNLNDFFSASDK